MKAPHQCSPGDGDRPHRRPHYKETKAPNEPVQVTRPVNRGTLKPGSWGEAGLGLPLPRCWEHRRPRSRQERVRDPKDDRDTSRSPQGHSGAQGTPRKTRAPAAPSQGHAHPHGGPRGLVHGVGTLPAWSPNSSHQGTGSAAGGRCAGRREGAAASHSHVSVRPVSFLHPRGSCLRPTPGAACGRCGFVSQLVGPAPGSPAQNPPRSPLRHPEGGAGSTLRSWVTCVPPLCSRRRHVGWELYW